MMKKAFCVLMAALVILANVSISVSSELRVQGIDYSGYHSGTYIVFDDGTTEYVEYGKEKIFTDSRPCEAHYKIEWGWMKVKKQPTHHINIQLKKVDATHEEFLLSLMVLPRSKRIILNYPPANSPWHLPAGIPMISSALTANGHEVVQRYSHISGVEHVLRKYGGGEVDWALETIRGHGSDIISLHRARMILEKVSRYVPTSDYFSVTRNNVTYISACGDGTLGSALAVLKNKKTHLWHDYFTKVELPIVSDFNPHIYGISVADERQLIPGLVLASMVKENLPNTLVVLGGNFWSRVPHLYSDPEFVAFFNHFDAIVYKEGFIPTQDLAMTLQPAQSAGVVWRNGDQLVVNPIAAVPADFENLPTPNFFGGASQWSPEPVYPLYTMSNCPAACGFCAISAGSDTYNMKPRSMTPKRIAEHMQKLPASRFDITDESFPISRQLALGKALADIGHSAQWQCYLNVTNELLDPQVSHKLFQSGCRAVQLGLESMSQSTLQRECKAWNHPENYGRILENLHDAGIQTHVFLMTSLPGEPLTESLKWLPFLEEHGNHILTIKAGRYRLARMSREEQTNCHSQHIEVTESKPLHLNKDFHYKDVSRKRVEAMRDLLEQACRQHWAYGVTSTIPWWINRGRYTWEELREMSNLLPVEESVSHFPQILTKVKGILRDEIGKEVALGSYEDVIKTAYSI